VCVGSYPHLSQRSAKPAPDRSGQPFLHSPAPAAGAPHAEFMHLFGAAAAAMAAMADQAAPTRTGEPSPPHRMIRRRAGRARVGEA
jgi:hypothetical protein